MVSLNYPGLVHNRSCDKIVKVKDCNRTPHEIIKDFLELLFDKLADKAFIPDCDVNELWFTFLNAVRMCIERFVPSSRKQIRLANRTRERCYRSKGKPID